MINLKMINQRMLKTLTMMAVLLCVGAVPALALTSKVIVTNVSPDGGSTNVDADSNVSATFNIRMAKSTINNKTFYLKQEGSTAMVRAQVVYTGTTKTATLNPTSDLASGVTYTAYLKGGRKGVRGAGGQKLGGTTDTTAIFADAKASWSFTVDRDTVAPDAPSAHLDANSNSGSKNDNLTNDNTPTIAGTAEAGSTVKIYDAQNDVLASVTADNAGAWSHTFGALQDGTYSYTVTTTDAAGNESQGSPISLTVDTAAPETTIDPSSVPPTNTSSTSASFTFSSSEANASFECSLDGAPFASCTSPKPVPDQGSLADSSHTFKVRATDAAGNTEGTPPSHAWTVDTIAPTVVSVSPAIAATGVAPSSNVTATFSEAMNSSSISDQTFTLKKQGSLSNLGATVSYDPTTKKATLDPSTDLTPSTTYTATITTGVKDSAGNTLAQVRSWTFTTGIVRPTVVSYAPTGSPPPGLSTNVTATFSTAMDPNTITTNTFTLTRVGSSVPLAAHVTYDSASKTATLDPDVNLSDSTSYTAVTKSGSDGVKDLQGNSLAQDFSWGFMPCDGGVILSAQSIHTQGIVVCG